MDKHPKNGWLKSLLLTLMHRLKQFAQLWSLQTLLDLPDRLKKSVAAADWFLLVYS
ncbi:hypothetical protein [uncultured Psychrobacter sp.]|uniref:hypothetical protein n=1 Tax=uncultured Psychrobacter sp. TaxID=259303 RepID=UPI00259583B5|nr:hypothetical protein [uncultured Psychrobacter sp.]